MKKILHFIDLCDEAVSRFFFKLNIRWKLFRIKVYFRKAESGKTMRKWETHKTSLRVHYIKDNWPRLVEYVSEETFERIRKVLNNLNTILQSQTFRYPEKLPPEQYEAPLRSVKSLAVLLKKI